MNRPVSIVSRAVYLIRAVENLREPERPWVLIWQTKIMPAPSFWYFETREAAQHCADASFGR